MSEKNYKDILREFATLDSPYYKALVMLLDELIDDLRDIGNIDLEKNVGLQTCARAQALKVLEKALEGLYTVDRPKVKPKSYR